MSGCFLLLPCFLEIPVLNANCVDPDQTPRSVASDLGLHCLLRLVRPNTYCKYDIQLNLVISNSLISNYRLSRSENLVPVLT